MYQNPILLIILFESYWQAIRNLV